MKEPYVDVDNLECSAQDSDSTVLGHLDIIKDGKIIGPANHIISRLISIPAMLGDYIESNPTPEEVASYTDPKLLQYTPEQLQEVFKNHFEKASEALSDRNELDRRFALLGELGELLINEDVETVYPAMGSTQAYENFGIFHLFPSNKLVNLTSTSPGVILPTEADPMKYKDDIKGQKNLLRAVYFKMLSHSVDPTHFGEGRSKQYFASETGTAKNLQKYPKLLGAAKEILQSYLDLGPETFEIRLGNITKVMSHVTLIGDIGIVYSVRDSEDKKINHNITVIDPKPAMQRRDEFYRTQWEIGKLAREAGIVDELAAAKE